MQCLLVAAGGWWESAQSTIEVGGLPPPTSQNNMDSWWHHWNSCRKVSGDAVNVMLTGATMTVSRYIEMIFIQNIETLPFVFTNCLCPWISKLQTLPAGYGAVQGETWGIALGWSLAISQEVIQIDEFTSDLESRLTHAYGLYTMNTCQTWETSIKWSWRWVCGLYTDCKLDKLAASGGVQQVAMGGVQLQPQALQGDMNMLGTSGDVGADA